MMKAFFGTKRSCNDRSWSRLIGAGLIGFVLVMPLRARATTVTIDADRDAWMDQLVANQNVNHGSEALLDVQTGSSTQVKRRGLVHFNLSSIPVCASVSSATLRMRIEVAPASSRTHGMHRLLKDWTESGVTWLKTDGTVSWSGGGANDASDSAATASATAATGISTGAVIAWNVTADANDFVAHPLVNFGWLLRDESEGSSPVLVRYDAKENTGSGAVPPRLEITYVLDDVNCDDLNLCTTDTCGSGGCEHVNNSLPCDDSVFCNGADVCAAGECTHAGDPCVGADGDEDCSESCDETADNCLGADPDGTLCRPDGGECDVEETCLGGSCPADAFELPGAPCGDPSDTDCDNPDTCDGNNACRANHEALGFSCGDPTDTDCTDPDSCDGAGSCRGNDASSGSPCADDGEACTADECDGGGTCTHAAGNAGAECRAAVGDCDVAETCDGSVAVCPADVKQPDDTPCDDALFCNGEDSCTGGLCVNHDGGVCTFVCDEPNDQCVVDECPESPQDTCRGAEKSKLLIKNSDSDERDALVWKFIRGESSSFADLADPMVDANYTLCLYAGPDAALAATVGITPGSSKWSVVGNAKGYKYSDKSGASSGVQKAKLKASAKDRTKMLIKARGAGLPEILGAQGLPVPVTAQLLNHASGQCWEGVFTGVPAKNTVAKFKANQ